MTIFKKFSVILAALVMVLSFASCNNTGQSANPSGDNSALETAVPDEQLEDLGSFTVLVRDSGAYANATDNDLVKQHIIEKIAHDRKVKIDMNVIPVPANDFINQANTYLTSQPVDGVSVDFAQTYGQLLGSPGLCIPIDTLLQQYGSNVMMVIGDTYWKAVMQNNQIMGIPSTAIGDHTVMIGRKDILNMAGITDVKTKDEFQQACVMYKALGYTPLALTWAQINDLLNFTFGIPSGDYDYDSKSGSIMMREDYYFFYYVWTKELTEISFFLNQMRSFYEKDYLDDEVFTATPEQMREKFINGEAAIYAPEYENVYNDYLALKANDPNAEIMVIQAPTSRRMAKPTLSGEQKVDNVLLFTASGQHQQALMTFKDWMYSDQTAYMEAMDGANGVQINFNPYESTYEYLDGYSADAPTYTGLYTLGINLDGIFPMPKLLSNDETIAKRGEIEKMLYDYLDKAEVRYEPDLEITDQTAMAKMATYRQYMDQYVSEYITGQINDYQFQEKARSLDDEDRYIVGYLNGIYQQQQQ